MFSFRTTEFFKKVDLFSDPWVAVTLSYSSENLKKKDNKPRIHMRNSNWQQCWAFWVTLSCIWNTQMLSLMTTKVNKIRLTVCGFLPCERHCETRLVIFGSTFYQNMCDCAFAVFFWNLYKLHVSHFTEITGLKERQVLFNVSCV